MPRISFSEAGETPFERLMGHNPEILARWSALEEALFSSGSLKPEIKEQVRRTLAFGNRCEYCMVRGEPAEEHPDPREDSLSTSPGDRRRTTWPSMTRRSAS